MTALSENWRKKADFEKVKSELGCKAVHPAALRPFMERRFCIYGDLASSDPTPSA